MINGEKQQQKQQQKQQTNKIEKTIITWIGGIVDHHCLKLSLFG
jgi:hypothetical protein